MIERPTIAALATPPMPSGIAVIRISGPQTKVALKALFRAKVDPVSDPRRLVYGELLDSGTEEVIDHCLAVFMPGPHSYTGEDVGEFQFHGSPLVVERILRSLFGFGITPAEPGEFTKRAFLNGKLDLVQAEAICDLINATSEQAFKIANENLKGKLSSEIGNVSEPLRNVLAELNASIDFPEEDISPQKIDALKTSLVTVGLKLDRLIESYDFGHRVKDGYKVLLAGLPNVGKSSILNLVLGTPRAIVTETSGTTRDVLEEEVILSGYKFLFCDTAGIHDGKDEAEQIGVERARERLDWADLILFIADATDKDRKWETLLNEIRGENRKIWMVTNKIDLNPSAIGTMVCDSRICEQNFYVSAKTRDGIDALLRSIVDEVSSTATGLGDTASVVANERHRGALSRARISVSRALEGIDKELPTEVIAAEVQLSLSALDEIIGKTYTEDILGRIFSKFCIGK